MVPVLRNVTVRLSLILTSGHSCPENMSKPPLAFSSHYYSLLATLDEIMFDDPEAKDELGRTDPYKSKPQTKSRCPRYMVTSP